VDFDALLTASFVVLSGWPFRRVDSGAYNDEVGLLGGLDRHYRLLASGLAAPLVACLILLPFRGRVPNTSAALLLVLVVVAVASAGDRLAGLLAAVAAGLAFDFFLTVPFQQITIASAADVQTT